MSKSDSNEKSSDNNDVKLYSPRYFISRNYLCPSYICIWNTVYLYLSFSLRQFFFFWHFDPKRKNIHLTLEWQSKPESRSLWEENKKVAIIYYFIDIKFCYGQVSFMRAINQESATQNGGFRFSYFIDQWNSLAYSHLSSKSSKLMLFNLN